MKKARTATRLNRKRMKTTTSSKMRTITTTKSKMKRKRSWDPIQKFQKIKKIRKPSLRRKKR